MSNKKEFFSTLLLAFYVFWIANISCLHWGMERDDALFVAFDAASFVLAAMIFCVIVKKTKR